MRATMRSALATLILFATFFVAPVAHAATSSITTDPIPATPGGATVTVTGRVTPTPATGSTIWLDGIDNNGIYHSHIADGTTKTDGTFAISTLFGAGTPGTFQIRSASVPADQNQPNWPQSGYQSFERANQITITANPWGTSAPRNTPFTISGKVYPARGTDDVIIDAIDSNGHYLSRVAVTHLNNDGTWTATTNLTTYPDGLTRFRAAVDNGWWARSNYAGYWVG